MANNEFLEDLEAAEARLLQLYRDVYGSGSSEFRQFKEFLLNGIRKGRGRKIIAALQSTPIDTGKEQGVNKGNESPVLPLAPKTLAVLPNKQQERDQSGAAVVAEDSDIKDDILKMSITAVTEKYTGDQLREYAKFIGATIADTMNDKQAVKAIAAKLKSDESKG